MLMLTPQDCSACSCEYALMMGEHLNSHAFLGLWRCLFVYIRGNKWAASRVQHQANVSRSSKQVTICTGVAASVAASTALTPPRCACRPPRPRPQTRSSACCWSWRSWSWLMLMENLQTPQAGPTHCITPKVLASNVASCLTDSPYTTAALSMLAYTEPARMCIADLPEQNGILDSALCIGLQVSTKWIAVQVCTLAACTTSTSASRQTRAQRYRRRPSSATGRRTWSAA